MKIENLITKEEKIFILEAIDTFFSLHLNIKQKSTVSSGCVNKISKSAVIHICSRNTKDCNELYLRVGNFERYGLADVKQMIIARISFNEKFQRIGHGVLLLLLKLCEIARKFNYEIIRFEYPNEDCKAFAKRLGFNEKTWAIEREKLVSNLKKYLKDKFKNSAGLEFQMKILKLCQKA